MTKWFVFAKYGEDWLEIAEWDSGEDARAQANRINGNAMALGVDTRAVAVSSENVRAQMRDLVERLEASDGQ